MVNISKSIPFVTALSIRGIGAFFTLAISFLIAKNLNSEDAGLYFLFVSIVSFFGIILTLGFNFLIVKRFSILKNKVLLSKYLLIVLSVILFVCLFVSMFFLFFKPSVLSFIDKPQLDGLYLYVLIAITLWALNVIFCSVLQGLGKSNFFVFFQNVTPYSIVFIFGMYSFFIGVEYSATQYGAFLMIGLLLSIVSSILFIYFFLNMDEGVNVSGELSFTDVPYFFISQTSQYLLFSGVVLLNLKFISLDEVAGIYLAQRLAAVITILLMVVNTIATPKFASLYSNGRMLDLELYIGKCSRFSLYISLPVVMMYLFFPAYVLSFFGSNYSEHAILLFILTLGNFFAVACGPVMSIANMTGQEKFVAVTNLLLIVPVFIIGHWLSVQHGSSGLVFTILIAFVFQNYPVAFYLKKKFGYYPVLGGFK